MPRASTGAEVGVWRGDFANMILERVQPRELHLIDPWIFFDDPEHAGSWYGGGVAKSQSDMDAIFDGVRRRLDTYVRSGVVVIHRQTSEVAAHAFEDGYFDWVYIDGDHTYDAVKLDLEMYGRKVRPGGLICGDDYSSGRWWGDGVIRAVDEYIEDANVEVMWIDAAEYVLRRLV